ncbi:helix-turn-helix domain-containing protein [Halostagnicola sp. A-GB9-2]|uniref:helix-turn-helix domain-containing protein n=1 Tax=Halostagnicola sp. A-GB9-2 TaxID=3048066 RepID=UPI0024BFCE76|nr:helix-turn-helix domain-containing protein [Halostagnicola sp. A-GB9-2]MDJ1432244.1 helix-turn-helix domain-containing protein [Halostagnicola sp. A-GB9-2]
MKTVRLILRHDAETIHPMHRFVAEHDAFDSYRMVHGNFSGEEERSFIFHVVGDATVYERALEEFGGTVSYDLTETSERSFSVYVRDAPEEVGQELLAAFTRGTLVALPPVEYCDDWTIRFSVVGESEDLRRALETVPDGIDATVQRIGEYERPDSAPMSLTERQREALRVARAKGYYAIPREASVEDVAEELGVTPGTAAEHLQKAESRVIRGLEL